MRKEGQEKAIDGKATHENVALHKAEHTTVKKQTNKTKQQKWCFPLLYPVSGVLTFEPALESPGGLETKIPRLYHQRFYFKKSYMFPGNTGAVGLRSKIREPLPYSVTGNNISFRRFNDLQPENKNKMNNGRLSYFKPFHCSSHNNHF